MVERILEQHKAIQQVLSEDKKHRHLIPTWQDVEVLESVNKALGPLLEFTDALSGEQQVTVSYVTPYCPCSTTMSWQFSRMIQT